MLEEKKSQLLTLCLCCIGPLIPVTMFVCSSTIKDSCWKWYITVAFTAKEPLWRKRKKSPTLSVVFQFSVCSAGPSSQWLVFQGCWTWSELQSFCLIILYSQTEQVKSYCLPHCTSISGRELLCEMHRFVCFGDELKGRNGNVWQGRILTLVQIFYTANVHITLLLVFFLVFV